MFTDEKHLADQTVLFRSALTLHNNYIHLSCDFCNQCVFKNGDMGQTFVIPSVLLTFIEKYVIKLTQEKITNILAIPKSYFDKNFTISSVSNTK